MPSQRVGIAALRRGAVPCRGVPLLAVLALLAAPALGDIFHLKSGGRVSGELVDTVDGVYEIRAVVGTIRLAVDDVERIEEAETPFAEYERRAGAAADTAAEQLELAEWCEEQGLPIERRKHLKRVLELDPDSAPARRALGYVRVGELWVDGRRIQEGRSAQDGEGGQSGKGEVEREESPEVIQARWNRRVRAIRSTLLRSSLARLRERGRREILDIRDPLAIYPLSELLSEGGLEMRALLVESLKGFADFDATMNLAILALVDPSEDIRGRALSELAQRNEPAVIAQYREALASDNDLVVKRAAVGLKKLGAEAAVPDLIRVLTVQRRKLVEVPVRKYFDGWPRVVNGRFQILRRVSPERVGIGRGPVEDDYDQSAWKSFGYEWTMELRRRLVTVYRSEVREALRELTGQDFGFDTQKWQRWYEEYQP